MKYPIVLCFLFIFNFAYADELDENNGASEFYHQKLHGAEEAYLVQYEQVTYMAGKEGSKDKIEMSVSTYQLKDKDT